MGVLIPYGVLIKRGNLETDMYTGTQHEDEGRDGLIFLQGTSSTASTTRNWGRGVEQTFPYREPTH